MAAHRDLLRQGEVPQLAHVLLEGQACRYRVLADGRRQITALLIPGDICDLPMVFAGRAMNGVGALTDCRFGKIAVSSFADFDELEPGHKRILWQQILRDEAIAREWLTCMGRLKANERLAHLFCELWTRLREAGLADGEACEIRLTQVELGDVLGLSSVHVNRTMKALHETGFIKYQDNALRILNHRGLAKIANFDPGYLQKSAL